MKKKTITKGKKYTIWILNLSIFGLISTSLFPLISVPEYDAVKKELYFNFEMMNNSDNFYIYSLVSDVNLINLLFWAIIGLGLLSIFCIIYLTFLTRWYLGLLTIICTAIFILSILVIILQYNFIKDVADIDFITLSTVFYTITYVHIIFLFSIFLLICSIFYLLNVILDLGKHIFSSKTKKQILTKKDPQEDSTSKLIVDKQFTQPPEPASKKVKIERWINQDNKNIDKKSEEDNYTVEKEVMEPIETTTEEKMYINNKIATSEKENQQGPFAPEKPKEKSEETAKQIVTQSFEDVLSSAIEKKQSEIGKKEQKKPISQEAIIDSGPILKDESSEHTQNIIGEKQEETINEKDTISKEIIVKCPQCNHIFTINKEETAKIKCPKCGKEGIAQ